MQPDRVDVKQAAQGRWPGILASLGILDQTAARGKHTQCPICRGGPKSESFRFDDKEGRGTFICSHCGAGNGVDLVMKARGVDFLEAKKLIMEQVPGAAFNAPRAKEFDSGEARRKMTAIWEAARPLDGKDPASQYLLARDPRLVRFPSGLRYAPELAYKDDRDDAITRLLPAMIGKFSAPDGKSATLHRTWLHADPPGKADVAKPRRLYAGPVPLGGAIRLGPIEEEMGIAEGIETAISAGLSYDLPVWAATGAVELIKFEPPKECRRLRIFADSDPSFTGQMAAYALANRLRVRPPEKRIEVSVQLTRYFDQGFKEDFNDEELRLLAAA